MKHDVLSERLRQLSLEPREARACFIGSAVWKHEPFPAVINRSYEPAALCSSPLSKGLNGSVIEKEKAMLYTLALFTHIVGVLGLFICVSFELAGLFGLRRARLLEEIRAWNSLHQVITWAFPLAALLTLGAGLFLALDAWGWKVPWIDVAFFAFIAMGLLGRLNASRHQQLHRALGEAPSGPVPAELRPQLHDAVLWFSTLLLTALGLGVVFLMTVKPDLLGSLLALAITILIGLGAGVALRGVRQTGRQSQQNIPA